MHVHIVEISCSVLCFYNKISEVVCIIRERGLLWLKKSNWLVILRGFNSESQNGGQKYRAEMHV